MGQILFGLTWGMILFFGLRKRSARLRERGRAPKPSASSGASPAATQPPSPQTETTTVSSRSGEGMWMEPIQWDSSTPIQIYESRMPFGGNTDGGSGPAPLPETYAAMVELSQAARRAGKQMRGERVGP